MKHPFFSLAKSDSPRVIAHRGFTGDVAKTTGEAASSNLASPSNASGTVENTLQAFANAVAMGVDYLESDCRLTKDEEVVLFHDEDLKRITGEELLVRNLTLRELSARLKDHGGLLTLSEAFEAFPKAHFNIDVKTQETAGRAGKIIGEHHERALLTSFDDETRQEALHSAGNANRPATSPGKSALIRILTSLLTGAKTRVARDLKNFDALQVPLRQGMFPVLTRPLIKAAHSAGLEVHAWTINDTKTMRRLKNIGVDGLVTDRSDIALEI